MDELKKYKRGDVREDGLVFAAYRKNTKNLEWWVTPEQQQECYFWRILTRFLTCSYDYANAA